MKGVASSNVGARDFDGADVASTIYYGLFALQHRGQGELRYCSQIPKRLLRAGSPTREWDL